VGAFSIQQFFCDKIEQRVGSREVKQPVSFSARDVLGAAHEQAFAIRSQYRT
jgi:hypothetical protein